LGEFSHIGQIFEKYRNIPNLWTSTSSGKSCALILTKNGLGYILGDFFTNSSGRCSHVVPPTISAAVPADVELDQGSMLQNFISAEKLFGQIFRLKF
jgi:hypothetical protein